MNYCAMEKKQRHQRRQFKGVKEMEIRNNLPQPIYDDHDVAALVHGEGMDLFHVFRWVKIAPEDYATQKTDFVLAIELAEAILNLNPARSLEE
jgi:hypothetical protein